MLSKTEEKKIHKFQQWGQKQKRDKNKRNRNKKTEAKKSKK